MRNLSTVLSALLVLAYLTGCGGYKAADADDLSAQAGQIVGVLVDSKGKSHPDATVQLVAVDGTSVLLTNNMDSDGSFSLWPPAPGTYNVIGVLGDTEKVIKQNVVVAAGEGVNVGNLAGETVAIVSVQVATPAGTDPQGVLIQALGAAMSATTVVEGVGALAGIPAGTYRIRFSKEGLTDVTLENVVVKAADTKLLDKVTLSGI